MKSGGRSQGGGKVGIGGKILLYPSVRLDGNDLVTRGNPWLVRDGGDYTKSGRASTRGGRKNRWMVGGGGCIFLCLSEPLDGIDVGPRDSPALVRGSGEHTVSGRASTRGSRKDS